MNKETNSQQTPYQRHRAERLAYQANYYATNRKKCLDRQTRYYQEHREERLAYQNEYSQRKRSLNKSYIPRPRTYTKHMNVITPLPTNDSSNLDQWYDNVRLNILQGISTKTLSPADQDKFWNEFNRRFNLKHNFRADTGGKYHGLFMVEDCGHKINSEISD